MLNACILYMVWLGKCTIWMFGFIDIVFFIPEVYCIVEHAEGNLAWSCVLFTLG